MENPIGLIWGCTIKYGALFYEQQQSASEKTSVFVVIGKLSSLDLCLWFSSAWVEYLLALCTSIG